MSLYDEHPLPWQAERMPEWLITPLVGEWWVLNSSDQTRIAPLKRVVAAELSEPVAKLLAAGPDLLGIVKSLDPTTHTSSEWDRNMHRLTMDMSLPAAIDRAEGRDAE